MRLIALLLSLAALLPNTARAAGDCAPLLDHQMRPLAGDTPVHLCEAYQGKVLLVVNTASKCGYTPQYEGLEALYAANQARGLVVLGFPSNDFLGQEPGSETEIKEFCTLTYGVKFPMFEKVSVRGRDTAPLFRALKQQTGEAPGWNFHKYLIDRSGKAVASFGSRTRPDDPALLQQIETLLAQAAPTE